jgi:hypothetical protein
MQHLDCTALLQLADAELLGNCSDISIDTFKLNKVRAFAVLVKNPGVDQLVLQHKHPE